MDAGAGRRMDFSRYPRKELLRDDALFFEEEESRELYLLLVGSLGVFRDEVLIATLDEPLTIVGEVSALTGEPRGATVRALRKSTLVEVADPDGLFAEYPQMGAKLARLLATRLQAMNRRFVELKTTVARGAPPAPPRIGPVTSAPNPTEPHVDPGDLTIVKGLRSGDIDDDMFAALTSILDFNPDTT